LDTIKERTKLLNERLTNFQFKVPGLLVIDTPGHESFNNLRTRGSSLCDIAVLVVDLMHGLEPQTIESINLLKMRKCPFVVALNKVDRLYSWKPCQNLPIQDALKLQNKEVIAEFENRVRNTIVAFAEQGLNAALYYRNTDFRTFISLIPTSAISGEGIPDLLLVLIQLTQRMMKSQITLSDTLECTVLEVKVIEGFGTTIDVILSDGEIHEGDQIVICGLNGPIVTTIRALLTPQPLKELRFKGVYQHSKFLKAAQGIKIAAPDLDNAVAGAQLFVVKEGDDIELLKKEVMKDYETMIAKIDKSGIGVWVQASTLGSLEALLEFLKKSKIPVSGINLGPIHKKDVIKAAVMLERAKDYAVILAFDVKVSPDAQEFAAELGVRIMTANIIYHLFDQFGKYMEDIKNTTKQTDQTAVFPCILEILPEHIYRNKNPIILGVQVIDGSLHLNTPIVVKTKGVLVDIGNVTSIENNHNAVEIGKKGDSVCIRLEGAESSITFGRSFTAVDKLYSKISRESISALNKLYQDVITTEDSNLLKTLKVFFEL